MGTLDTLSDLKYVNVKEPSITLSVDGTLVLPSSGRLNGMIEAYIKKHGDGSAVVDAGAELDEQKGFDFVISLYLRHIRDKTNAATMDLVVDALRDQKIF